MKVFIAIVVLTIVALATAEPPRPRFNSRQRFFARQEVEQLPAYQRNGWQPSRFSARQTDAAQPADKYGPPPEAYGPPPEPTTDAPEPEPTTDPNLPNTEAESLRLSSRLQNKDAESVFKNVDRGLYYIRLSDGRIQRVVYMTSADRQNMAYSANVKFQDVDPVSAPLYAEVQTPVVQQALVAQPVVPQSAALVQPIVQQQKQFVRVFP